MSIQRLMRGRSASRIVGREVMKIHPRRFSAHFVAVQTEVVSASFGSRRKLSATHIQGAKDAGSLLRGFRVDQHPNSVSLTRRSISAGSDIH